MSEVLGIDIGGVIKDSGYIGSEVPGAIEGIARIQMHGRFSGIYLVSQTLSGSRWYVLNWLTKRNFWSRTGIAHDEVLFCNRSKHKAIIAVRLHITHFIDDRPCVLHCMPESVSHRFLFGGSHSGENLPHNTIYVPDWDTLAPFLLLKAA